MALLQPAPEVYDLFDDVLLMSEGAPCSIQHEPCLDSLQAAQTYVPACSHPRRCPSWRVMSETKLGLAAWKPLQLLMA